MIEVNYNEYKETIAQNMKLVVENHDLKEEIERLKEENTILKQTMSNNSLLINENAFLKERIDKAIEYIEEKVGNEIHDMMYVIDVSDLLNILKGVDKE